MNFITLPFLCGIILVLFTLSVIVGFLKAKTDRMFTIQRIVFVAIFLLFSSVFLFGYVEDSANGARINTDGTITLFTQYKHLDGESATSKLKLIGKTEIKYTKDKKQNTINNRVKVKRNLVTGTTITVYKEKGILLEDK